MNFEEMKSVLGMRVLSALIGMALVTIFFATFSLLFLVPQTAAQQGKLSEAKTFVDTKRAEITSLRQEYADLQTYLKAFKELERRQFFADQNRIEARRSLDQVVNQAGLIRANYEIKPAQVVSQVSTGGEAAPAEPPPEGAPAAPPAAAGEQTLIASEIEIEFEAYDDVQVYNFIKMMQDTFQGLIGLQELTIEPVEEFTPDIFLQIGNGAVVPLVKGKMTLFWYSMVPADTAKPVGTPQ